MDNPHWTLASKPLQKKVLAPDVSTRSSSSAEPIAFHKPRPDFAAAVLVAFDTSVL